MNLSIGNKRIRIRTSFGRTVAWIFGIIAFILALFPIWWMFNIVFSPAGIPIALNPRLYPTSLVDGIENIQADPARKCISSGHMVTRSCIVSSRSLAR